MMRYRGGLGFWAWVTFRVAGGLLFLYLIAHICVLSFLLKGEASFNALMGPLQSPLAKVLEIGLIACVIYHGLNGIRVVFVDFFEGALYHKKLFWALFVIGLILFVASALPILSHL